MSMTRREFLGWAMGAGALALAPALRDPEAPMGLLGLIDDSTYANQFYVARPDWAQFEWDDTPMEWPAFDPEKDAFAVVFRQGPYPWL